MLKYLLRGAVVFVIMLLTQVSARPAKATAPSTIQADSSKEFSLDIYVFPVANKWGYDRVEFHCMLTQRGEKAKKEGRVMVYDHYALSGVIIFQGGTMKEIPSKELDNWKRRFREIFPKDKPTAGTIIA